MGHCVDGTFFEASLYDCLQHVQQCITIFLLEATGQQPHCSFNYKLKRKQLKYSYAHVHLKQTDELQIKLVHINM